ncbi:hypothetical protein Pfo_024590 [Paulownia fortunei]|nr:hypothetical protein Pfo_024590 [Paulownia fortunei]
MVTSHANHHHCMPKTAIEATRTLLVLLNVRTAYRRLHMRACVGENVTFHPPLGRVLVSIYMIRPSLRILDLKKEASP